MVNQLLRRPVRGCQAPTALPCPAQLPRLQRPHSHVRPLSKAALCPSRAPQPLQQRQPASPVIRLEPRQAAADSGAAEVIERKRSRLQIDTSPEIIEGPDALELPMPSEYQQTLWSSFTLAGIGLHTGEYACIRVRPAFAGEGRYFVRVPDGTNAGRAAAGMQLEEPIDTSNSEEAVLDDPEYRQELVSRYQEYIDAQEEEGFGGSFVDYLNAQEYTELVERLREEGPPTYTFSKPEAPQPRSEEESYLPAAASYIWEPNPVTTTLANDDFQVVGVEALLSALEACGVDNARIEIEGGPELPVIDGSAEGWTREVCSSGLCPAQERVDLPVWSSEVARAAAGGGEAEEEAEEEEEEEEGEAERRSEGSGPRQVPKLVLRPQQVVSVTRGSSFVTLYPEDTFRITAGLDRHREAPVIGKQWLSWCMFEDVHYRHSLSDARGFVSSPEQAMAMREAGWLLGGTEGVMLIGYGERWYDPELLRHVDEPVRHQIQDLIGDLSLLARDGHSGLPCGHIVSYDADHELYAAFVSKLLEVSSDADWVPIRSVAGPSLPVDYKELMESVIEDEEEDGDLSYGEGEDEGGQAGEGEEEEEGQEEMYDEHEGGDDGEGDEGEGGEFEDEEEEEGVVDVEATPLDDPRQGGAGKGRR